jgi:AraC-like DNA-binding protein
MPAGCPYHTEVLEEGFMYTMHFCADLPFLDSPSTAAPPFPMMIENLFSEAVAHYAHDGCDLVTFSAAYRLLAASLPAFSAETLSPPRRMRQGKKYIDDNLTDPGLRVAALAEACNISEVYFRREFKKYYGTSPIAYIKEKRIELAKMLLETGLYSITEVAFRTGFESSSYFSAEFRRMTGRSPKDYRNA